MYSFLALALSGNECISLKSYTVLIYAWCLLITAKKRQQRRLFFCTLLIIHLQAGVRRFWNRGSVFFSYTQNRFINQYIFSVGYRLNDAASDLIAGIAGRLAGKIVSHAVDHHRTSQNGVYKEALVIKYLVCISLIAQKGRKIPCMLGMRHAVRIVVISGLIKRSGAVSVFVNVHAVEIAGSLYMDIGKPEDLGFHKDSAIRGSVKFHRACKLRL